VLSVAVVCVFLVGTAQLNSPLLLWNFTDSVPQGLYWLSPLPAKLERGMYVALKPPSKAVEIATGRVWFRPKKVLLKKVVGIEGDVVCNEKGRLLVKGEDLGPVFDSDRQGAPLPYFIGCFEVGAGDVFLLGPDSPWSFVWRVFGGVQKEGVGVEGRGRLGGKDNS